MLAEKQKKKEIRRADLREVAAEDKWWHLNFAYVDCLYCPILAF